VQFTLNAVDQTTDYTLTLIECLKEVCPDFEMPESLKKFSGQSIQTLNFLIRLVGDVASASRHYIKDLSVALIHVVNFYVATKNSTNWGEVSLGFTSLILSLFNLDGTQDLAKYIQTVVTSFFSKMRTFVKAESAEKSVDSVWSKITTSNPRSFVGMAKTFAGIMTTVVSLKAFVTRAWKDKDISSLVTTLVNSFLQIGSEFQTDVRKVTVYLARMYDFILLNAKHIASMQFDKIVWELPPEQVFESKFADVDNVMKAVLEDPLYMEVNNLTWESLRSRLNAIRTQCEDELNKNPVPSVRAAFTRYLQMIDNHLRLVLVRLNPANTKPQPMTLTIMGPAGCGKSSAATNLGEKMQLIAGRSPDTSLINCKGGDPKFEPAVTSNTDVIVFDDFANDQSQRMQTSDVINIVNVSREIIPKSASEEKGRHRYSNIGTIFTTNDENLGQSCFNTVSADSLLRRMGIVVKLGIKPEYCFQGTERLDINHPDVNTSRFNSDVYTVELLRPIGVQSVNGQKIVDYTKIDFDILPNCNEWKSAVYAINDILVEEWANSQSRHKMSLSGDSRCSACKLDKDVCTCCPIVAESLKDKISMTIDSASRLTTGIKVQAVQAFDIFDNTVLDFTSIAASRVSVYVLYGAMAFYLSKRLVHLYQRRNLLLSLFVAVASIGFITIGVSNALILTLCLAVGAEYFHIRRKRSQLYEQEIHAISYFRTRSSVRYALYGLTILAFAGVLKVLYNCFVAYTIVLSGEEAVVTSTCVEESPVETFTARREKTSSDAIGQYHIKPRPAHEARTMTESQCISDIANGISEVEVTIGDETHIAKCLPMGSERLIPGHICPTDVTVDIDLMYNRSKQNAVYKNRGVPASHQTTLIKKFPFSSVKIDAKLVHLPNVPPGKDFSRYFAEDGTLPRNAPCKYIHKDCTDGSHKVIDVRARKLSQPIRYRSGDVEYEQYVYECVAKDHVTSDGDCGQPLIYNNSIIGIHIAGSSSNTWYCLAVDRTMIIKANDVLKSESTIFVASQPPESITLSDNLKGLQISDKPTEYVEETLDVDSTPIVQLGTLLDAAGALYAPRAMDHYFRNRNPGVTEAFGEMPARPPKFVNGRKQIGTTLKKVNEPKMLAPIDLMDRAVEDYLYGGGPDGANIMQVANKLRNEHGENFFTVRPIAQALDGDQSGIVGGINNSTSSGLPFGGKKKVHMARDEFGNAIVPREPEDYIIRAIEHHESEWRSGRGTVSPFMRSSKTNELLPTTKALEKTRSIYGNDMSFLVAAIRGCIPLKHVLREANTSECRVGITAQGTEWGDLYNFLTDGGAISNFVCGDFSGYDTQLPKSLLEKASAIILRIYEANGMSKSDLEYVRGFLSSVVSPIIVWEGNILQFVSGQPSGQPLTTEMNSIINSLLLRMAFFNIMDEHYPDVKNPSFRSFVRAATYGDDNAMGVRSSIPKFNHTAIQSVFASWGIKYTMADKEADSVPYVSIDEVSFLKRNFRYHQGLKAIVAPIEVDSLTKGFYWWTKSSNTPLNFVEQFQVNFDGQAREAYLHGEDYYNEFVARCEHIVASTAEFDVDDDFHLPWNTIQPLSYSEMTRACKDAYIRD